MIPELSRFWGMNSVPDLEEPNDDSEGEMIRAKMMFASRSHACKSSTQPIANHQGDLELRGGSRRRWKMAGGYHPQRFGRSVGGGCCGASRRRRMILSPDIAGGGRQLRGFLSSLHGRACEGFAGAFSPAVADIVGGHRR
jgi:hypothetical protein